jgi:hypothetical protein
LEKLSSSNRFASFGYARAGKLLKSMVSSGGKILVIPAGRRIALIKILQNC